MYRMILLEKKDSLGENIINIIKPHTHFTFLCLEILKRFFPFSYSFNVSLFGDYKHII